jgi:D-glucosaminate-6-phosphate ammonia-lyase
MTSVADLGVKPLMNAAAHLTRLSGSLMPDSVRAAMVAASSHYVPIEELERAAARRIAELTRNEAALITAGAASGLLMAAAGCMTRGAVASIRRLPETKGLKDELVLFRSQRNMYDQALLVSGGTLVEVGNSMPGTIAEDLEHAITDRTAAVVFFAGAHLATGALPLATVVAIAHRHGVPVIVDAAAQLPPVENLWRFTEGGADLVIFSGGKAISGPQSSGLLLGRSEWVEYARLCTAPRYGPARAAKVGKEEIMGLLAAVEGYLTLDHPALLERWEREVRDWVSSLAELPGVTASRDFPNEAGQPVSRALIRLGARARLSRDQLVTALRQGTPAIEVLLAGEDGIYLNPLPLQEGEAAIVCERLRGILEGRE